MNRLLHHAGEAAVPASLRFALSRDLSDRRRGLVALAGPPGFGTTVLARHAASAAGATTTWLGDCETAWHAGLVSGATGGSVPDEEVTEGTDVSEELRLRRLLGRGWGSCAVIGDGSGTFDESRHRFTVRSVPTLGRREIAAIAWEASLGEAPFTLRAVEEVLRQAGGHPRLTAELIDVSVRSVCCGTGVDARDVQRAAEAVSGEFSEALAELIWVAMSDARREKLVLALETGSGPVWWWGWEIVDARGRMPARVLERRLRERAGVSPEPAPVQDTDPVTVVEVVVDEPDGDRLVIDVVDDHGEIDVIVDEERRRSPWWRRILWVLVGAVLGYWGAGRLSAALGSGADDVQLEVLEMACREDADGASCVLAAEWIHSTGAEDRDRRTAELLRLGCDAGHPRACAAAARVASQRGDRADAEALARRACALGDLRSCTGTVRSAP